MSKEEKPCPTCFEAPNPGVSEKAGFIWAKEWRELSPHDILGSMEIAIRVLRDKSVAAQEKGEIRLYAAAVIRYLAEYLIEISK